MSFPSLSPWQLTKTSRHVNRGDKLIYKNCINGILGGKNEMPCCARGLGARNFVASSWVYSHNSCWLTETQTDFLFHFILPTCWFTVYFTRFLEICFRLKHLDGNLYESTRPHPLPPPGFDGKELVVFSVRKNSSCGQLEFSYNGFQYSQFFMVENNIKMSIENF